MWQLRLLLDFGIDTSTQNDWKTVLNVKFPDPRATALFGVDFASDNFLLEQESAFEVWKYWVKANGRVGLGECTIYAPYFLRAAKFWKNFSQWSQRPENVDVGTRIRGSLGTAYEEFPRILRLFRPMERTSPKMAMLSVYAFTSGQGQQFRAANAFDGLFGGYQAYGYYSNMSLVAPTEEQIGSDMTNTMYTVANDLLGREQSIQKMIVVDGTIGGVHLRTDIGASRSQTAAAAPDEFLSWLEDYANCLLTGIYRADTMGTHPREPTAISLFPQPSLQDPPLRPTSETIPAVVSRAVTRGIEVMASAVFSPQGMNQFGFIYSIRIRLLLPGEEGYMTGSQRGFTRCQLDARCWRITNAQTGNTDVVQGNGVIGMYPVLREGGYTNGGEALSFDGTFQYQSCSGSLPSGGSFEGHITFVPGTLRDPVGEPFEVKVNPFQLNPKARYQY